MLISVLLFACGDSETAQKTGVPGLTFEFGKTAPGGADNWCRLPLPEAAVITADPVNSNRRLFTLSDGPHRVVVDFGHIVASFVLQKSGNRIEIFTSDNYPECLSNRENFSIGANGTTFTYQNNKHIDIEIQIVPLPNGTQIAIEMAPGSGYGIIVRR